jgi:hypothetical protein
MGQKEGIEEEDFSYYCSYRRRRKLQYSRRLYRSSIGSCYDAESGMINKKADVFRSTRGRKRVRIKA